MRARRHRRISPLVRYGRGGSRRGSGRRHACPRRTDLSRGPPGDGNPLRLPPDRRDGGGGGEPCARHGESHGPAWWGTCSVCARKTNPVKKTIAVIYGGRVGRVASA